MPKEISEIYSYVDEETGVKVEFKLTANDPLIIKKKKALRNLAKTFVADIDLELQSVENRVNIPNKINS